MESQQNPKYVAVGTVGKPVALHGMCNIWAYGSTLELLELPAVLKVGFGKPQTELTLLELFESPKGLQGKILGCDDRDAVDLFKNMVIFVPKSELPATEMDEYYHFELEGVSVVGMQSGQVIGTVVEVHNFPTVDALEVRKNSGGRFMVPFTKEVVLRVEKDVIFVDDDAVTELS